MKQEIIIVAVLFGVACIAAAVGHWHLSRREKRLRAAEEELDAECRKILSATRRAKFHAINGGRA